MRDGAATFIRHETRLCAHPFVPELLCHQASEIAPLWKATETFWGKADLPPPFWAFVWPGGAALARYVLDHPACVRGKRVLDFAAGSGIGGIAAAKAGAATVLAADIDPLSQIAVQMNAARNGVVIGMIRAIDLDTPLEGVDLILAGDVCYEQVMSIRVLRWLSLCEEKGAAVLLADPGRAYAPKDDGAPLAHYSVPTSLELEDRETREVDVWGRKKGRALEGSS